ncbi:hypothetical protein MPTK1_1g22570 [Marchantia polymorpha subsp. ruderalis]|uniref:Amino acid transporter transmembrane domain-containing protein n=2 Tax=Marchantia polymorpha TaxID=3197 RepID=A0AAF6AT60_MARPO|nr:hypothetical protein MARPO_0118s0030 [Marchantia polymorpha]BBM99630.1 hypothetical protein Mp_1g22570 [Marchantia polymorpha subsp. ruderalis]|eukprot:PTQ30895.1 hypothetical protein MARPO_0118s0030 [Marchantia polymorpha]
MRNSEKPYHQQIELQRRDEEEPPVNVFVHLADKSYDRSGLLPAGEARSDGFAPIATGNMNGNGALRNVIKQPADVLPLLARNNSASGGEDETPRAKEAKYAGASLRSAVFNLSTTIIGAGIMALPAAMRVLGVAVGLFVILVMGVLSEISLELVVRYSTQLKAYSYGDMVYGAWGKTGRFVAQMCVIINNGGILIVYLIIMGDVLSGSKDHTGLLEGWARHAGWWTDRKIVLLFTLIIVLAPLSFFKRIESLEVSSAISVALALLFVIIASGIAALKLVEGKLAVPRMVPAFDSKKNILDLLIVVPIMTNAFVCQFNVPPIYYELRDRSAPRMNKVGRISILLCVIVYMATALAGYLLFGDATDSDVLSNFDTDLGIEHSQFWNDLIRVGYVIHLFFVFPVINFSFRQTIDSLLFPLSPPLQDSNARFVILTSALLTMIYLGSTLIPNIWVAFQFTGATTGLALGFMFPALVALRSVGVSVMERKLAWTILLMAVVVSVVGVTTQIYSFATGQA